MSLIRGGNHDACLDQSSSLTGVWAGYVTRFSGNQISWSKFFEGTEADETVIKVPWVGLSRTYTSGQQNVFKNFVGFFIKYTKSEFIVALTISDGSVAVAHKLVTNPVASMDVAKHGDNFCF